MFKASGNYVWLTSPDGTDSVVAVTMGNVSAESIAEALNLLRYKEQREEAFARIGWDSIRQREQKEAIERQEQTAREIEEEVERVNEYILYGTQKQRVDSLRQAMREDVAQLHKIIHGQPQEVS